MSDLAHLYHPDVSVDRQLALRTAATCLARELDRTYDTEDPKPDGSSTRP